MNEMPLAVMGWDAERAKREAREAAAANADRWVTGCDGTEVPVLRNGEWYLYVWNPALRQHGWYRFMGDTVDEITLG